MSNIEKNQEIAAAKAGMTPKTARKYLRLGKQPSELASERDWRTRPDPFAEFWEGIREQLELNPGLEAKTLFARLQREHPGRFADGQLRTLQRQIKIWRATAGPAREVYFAQKHEPGRLCASDFTHMTELAVTIAGQSYPHLVYHFVLTYSNWETATICYGESFESLSEGLQNALWELGGVPAAHRTDSLSAAVNNMSDLDEFTARYQGLLDYYGMAGRKTQAGRAHENGDIEHRPAHLPIQHARLGRTTRASVPPSGWRLPHDRTRYLSEGVLKPDIYDPALNPLYRDMLTHYGARTRQEHTFERLAL